MTSERTPWLFHRKHGSDATLALEMTETCVRLYVRQEDGDWSAIGEAQLASNTFSEQIDALRVEAMVREKNGGRILVWLPEEQVLIRQYLLEHRGEAAKAEAHRRFTDETTYSGDELCVALSPAPVGTPTTVLGALTQTVREASAYAIKWGFAEPIISTRHGEALFGNAVPIFELPPTISRKAGRAAFRMGSVAASVFAFVGAGYGAMLLFQTLSSPEVGPTASRAPDASIFNVADEPLKWRADSFSYVSTGKAQTLPIQRVSIPGTYQPLQNTQFEEERRPNRGAPATLDLPSSDAPMRVGAAPHLPVRTRPGKLIASLAPSGRTDIAALRSAIAAIREAGSTQESEASEPVARRDRFKRAPGSNVELAAIAPTAIVPIQPPVRAPKVPDAAENASPPEPAPSTFAPTNMNDAPIARPIRQTPEVVEKPAPVAAESENSPPPEPVVASTSNSASTVVLPPIEEVPQPLERPRSIVAAAKSAPSSAELASISSPRSVRSAAQKQGLLLDETSLIGVIDAKTGRHALVRTPTGDYRKLTQGDVLDGWRVSSIGREAMRLTRRGHNRTLLLVSR